MLFIVPIFPPQYNSIFQITLCCFHMTLAKLFKLAFHMANSVSILGTAPEQNPKAKPNKLWIFDVMKTICFLKPHEPTTPVFLFSACSFLLFKELEIKVLKCCSVLGLGLREGCGWFDLQSRSLKLPPYQQNVCFAFLSLVCSLE